MYISAAGLRARNIKLELCYLGNLRSVKNLLRARAMVSRIAGDFDLIHAQSGSACAVATAGARNVPKVVTLRGSEWHWYREKWNWDMIHGFFANAMTRKVLEKYDSIITVSHRMTNEVKSNFVDMSVSTIPSPIDLKSFRPVDKHTARAKLGFPDDKDKWILFNTLSLRTSCKRVQLAQEAVNRVKQRMGGIKLKVATGIPHADMPIFVNACDLILSTSVHEGWPNAVKEALACNIPFVATDTSDLSMIAKQEPSCRICPPDPDILAENICDVLSKPHEVDLRSHVFEMDVSVVSHRILDIYNSLNNKSTKAFQSL